MSAELKETIDTIGREWEEFKAIHAREREELATKGFVTGETTQLLERLNEAIQAADDRKNEIDAQNAAIEQLRASLNRPTLGGDGKIITLTEEQVAHREELAKYMRGHTDGAELREIERQALTRGTDTAGGYWVTDERLGTIQTTIFETSPMRQLASVQSISSDAMTMVDDYDEAGAAWAGEISTRSESTTPALGQIRIPVHELVAMPKASQQLLEDSEVDPESWLAGKVANKFARTSNTAFISGTGVTQPRGILGTTKAVDSGSGVARGSVGYMISGVAGGWKANTPGDNLIDLMHLLKEDYHANATWLMRRTIIGEIRKFATSTYAYVWEPSFQAGQPSTILGYPVRMAADMPAKADNAYCVAFGDFRAAYQIVDRVGISVLRDPYSAKPFVLFYTRARVGGDVVNYEAIKLLQLAD